MSGIFGICRPSGVIDRAAFNAGAARLTVGDEHDDQTLHGDSWTFRVAAQWTFQSCAQVGPISVAVDADLYNAQELRTWLEKKGIRAHSSAEIVAGLYRVLGDNFVDHLVGAFAVAIWDQECRRLLLTIDRLGIKGLHWAAEHEQCIFATRASAVAAAMEDPPSINEAAVAQYFIFSVVPAPATIYRNIKKMRPGHLLSWQNGRISHRKYWDLDFSEPPHKSEADWARAVREGIRDAVARTVQGCDPQATGAYLSGGTDSSSVVAFMDQWHRPVSTFSIVFSDPRYSEAEFSRTAAEFFQTRHHEKAITAAEAAAAVDKIAAYYDEPFANSSAIGSYYCAKMAAEAGCTMLLAGDGGDEIFAGNERYATDRRFQLYHTIPSFLRSGLIEPVLGLLPENGSKLSLPRRYVRRARIPVPRRLFSRNLCLEFEPSEIFEADFLRHADPSRWLETVESHFASAPGAASDLDRHLYLDSKLTLADNDLRKVSGTAELAGVRVRFPLLDHQLCSFAAGIPARLKLKGLEKRYIFKQALKGTLPERVLNKKKHGFGVPLALWLLSDRRLNSMMRDVLSSSRIAQQGYFRPEFLRKIAELHRTDHAAYYGEFIWYVMMFELWKQIHYQRAGVASGAH